MCLAILKPAGKHITRKQLRKGFKENSDGAGFMYVGQGQLQIKKGYFTFKSFYKSLRDTEKRYPNSHFVIHFRLSTSGKIDYTNCHPFFVNKQLGFVHNGIFAKLGNKVISDTQHYNFKVLQKYPKDFIYDAKILEKIDKFCSWSNKLVFLNNKNDYYIINEVMGEWVKDVWFSNRMSDVYYKYINANAGQWFDTTKYENESVVWDYCDKCQGFYPVDELVDSADDDLVLCYTCTATLEETPTYCNYCGNAYNETEEGTCNICGALCYGTHINDR